MLSKVTVIISTLIAVVSLMFASLIYGQFGQYRSGAEIFNNAKESAVKRCKEQSEMKNECNSLVVTDISELPGDTPYHLYYSFEVGRHPEYGSISIHISPRGSIRGIDYVPYAQKLN